MTINDELDRRFFKKMRPKFAFDLMTENETILKVKLGNEVWIPPALGCSLVNSASTLVESTLFLYSQRLVTLDQCLPLSPSCRKNVRICRGMRTIRPPLVHHRNRGWTHHGCFGLKRCGEVWNRFAAEALVFLRAMQRRPLPVPLQQDNTLRHTINTIHQLEEPNKGFDSGPKLPRSQSN